MIFECPGSQKFKRPQPEFIRCNFCNEEVEIWTDEFEAICPNCKRSVSRESGQSCLDWCKYAKECIGTGRYNKYKKAIKKNRNKKASQ